MLYRDVCSVEPNAERIHLRSKLNNKSTDVKTRRARRLKGSCWRRRGFDFNINHLTPILQPSVLHPSIFLPANTLTDVRKHENQNNKHTQEIAASALAPQSRGAAMPRRVTGQSKMAERLGVSVQKKGRWGKRQLKQLFWRTKSSASGVMAEPSLKGGAIIRWECASAAGGGMMTSQRGQPAMQLVCQHKDSPAAASAQRSVPHTDQPTAAMSPPGSHTQHLSSMDAASITPH
jgi:hypothetical protein